MAVSSLSMEAAVQAIQLEDRVVAGERTRNTTARDFTRDFFRSRGYVDTDTQANFVFVDVRMPIETFSQACRERGVRIARAFPPLNTYARVTIGTMEDMRRATDVFAQVLAAGRPA